MASYCEETTYVDAACALPYSCQDLVIWGHEHESLIDPKQGPEGKGFHVIQPGSTVATSLVESEVRVGHRTGVSSPVAPVGLTGFDRV